jgi:hypothetical protein
MPIRHTLCRHPYFLSLTANLQTESRLAARCVVLCLRLEVFRIILFRLNETELGQGLGQGSK